MKKGDLSMGVIIGAAIALLVLVLLSVLLFRSLGTVVSGTSCSAADGGYCIPGGANSRCSDEVGNMIPGPSYTCSDDTEKCCIPFGDQG